MNESLTRRISISRSSTAIWDEYEYTDVAENDVCSRIAVFSTTIWFLHTVLVLEKQVSLPSVTTDLLLKYIIYAFYLRVNF